MISDLDDRIKAIEQKEETYNKLISDNNELRQSISSLKAEFERIQYVVLQFVEVETQFNASEELRQSLAAENHVLKAKVLELSSEVSSLKSDIHTLQNERNRSKTVQELAEEGISAEQHKLNNNIVIRGIDFVEKSDEHAPLKVFDSIRTHLGLHQDATFNPIAVKVFPTVTNTPTSRTIQVQFDSADTKRKFLQVRHIKKTDQTSWYRSSTELKESYSNHTAIN